MVTKQVINEEIQKVIQEKLMTEYVNPNVGDKLDYIVNQLHDVVGEMTSNGGVSMREIDVVSIQQAISILERASKHMHRV